MNFPGRLAQFLLGISNSKKAFAKKCGISEAQLYNLLKGKNVPGGEFFIQLKKEYPNVDLDWLISGEGDSDQPGTGDKVVGIDEATQMLTEVESETGIQLSDRQRKAVIKFLRKELKRRKKKVQAEIIELIMPFKEGE